MKAQMKGFMFLCFFIALILFSCSDSKISDFERGKKFMELSDYDNAVKSFELAVWNQPDNHRGNSNHSEGVGCKPIEPNPWRGRSQVVK